jgi:hypothetical protein
MESIFTADCAAMFSWAVKISPDGPPWMRASTAARRPFTSSNRARKPRTASTCCSAAAA